MCLLIMLICTYIQTLVLQELHRQINPKLVNITVLTSTLDIRVKCASASFLDDERHMAEKHHTAEQDCMYCALMSDSSADCRMTVLL